MNISLVISLYNETRRLHLLRHHLITTVLPNPDFLEVILVNDGSIDGTSHTLRQLQRLDSKIRVIETKTNRGKGAGIRSGMAASSGDLILTSDADVATPITEYLKLIPYVRHDTGVVIGSRRHKGSDRRDSQPLQRRLVGRLLLFFSRILLFPDINDTQTGFKLYNAKAVQSVLHLCKVNRFLFDMELLLYLESARKLQIREASVDWIHTDYSSVSLSITTLLSLSVDFLYLLMKRTQLRISKVPTS